MKINKIFIIVALLALASPFDANAQISKLKDKAKQAVKDKVGNNNTSSSSSSRPMSLSEQHALEDQARLKARMAALNDDQKWALDQLDKLKVNREQPDVPKLIDPIYMENAKAKGEKYTTISEFVDALGSFKEDVIQNFRRMVDIRFATYNTRIIEICKTLPDGLDNYDPDYKLRPNLKILQDQMDLFAELQHNVDQNLMLQFSELTTTTDANGKIIAAKGAWLSSKGGHGVSRDSKDGKYKFAEYKTAYTYVLPEELTKQEKYLTWLKNCATILAGSETAAKSKWFDKCDLACTMIEQAIANNSKENITYIKRPAGSAMNTAQLKGEALKVLQKRFPSAGYSEVIITGDHWVEVKNVLGIVIERYIDVAAVHDGDVAKRLVWFTLGNDKTSSGWGPLHFYGTPLKAGGYVK